MSRTVVLVLVGAVVVVAAGVGVVLVTGDDDDGGRAEPSGGAAGPVVASAAGVAGTELGDGFTVVDGSVLVGDPIPTGQYGVVDGIEERDAGWTAMTVVDGGDPVEILDAYLRQADAAGLDDQRTTRCGPDRDLVTCSAFARSADPAEPRSLTVQAVRGRRGDVVSDHVVVRLSTLTLVWEYGAGVPDGDGGATVPEPADLPPLAGVGEPIGTADELANAVLVQEGSRLAAPPHLNLDDGTGGVVALLEVTGDPATVLEAYRGHLADLGGDSVTPAEEEQVGDAVVTRTALEQAGGDHIGLLMVERPGRPTWLRLEGSHD